MAVRKKPIDMTETKDLIPAPKRESKSATRDKLAKARKLIKQAEAEAKAKAKAKAKHKKRKLTPAQAAARKELIKTKRAVKSGKETQALLYSDDLPKSTHISQKEIDIRDAENKLLSKLGDRYWRLNNLYYIMDENGNRIKFKMNKVQEQIYRTLWHKNCILKSRQHGVTTFACILFLDEAVFKSNVRAGIIADTVPHAERFFEDKIKYAYDNLPEEIRAAVTCKTNNVREIKFSNNSMIYVSDQMKSGTLQLLHISEFGEISKSHPSRAKSIVSDAFPTVHKRGVIIIESTAEGKEGEFYKICTRSMNTYAAGTKLTHEDFKFMFYGWYLDPRNYMDDIVPIPVRLQDYFSNLEAKGIKLTNEQKYWYVKKEENLGDIVFKQYPSSAEEAFQESVEGAYYRIQMNKVREHGRIAKVPYFDSYNVDTYWDLGVGKDDYTSIWFAQKVGGELHLIDYYENTGEGIAHYVDILNSKPYRYGTHVGPHDIQHKIMGELAETRLQIAARLGLHFIVCDNVAVADGIEAVRSMLSIAWFDEEHCERGISCIDNYRKEWDAKNGQWRNSPLHNEFSHGADALRYCAVMWKKVNTVATRIDRPTVAPVMASSWS